MGFPQRNLLTETTIVDSAFYCNLSCNPVANKQGLCLESCFKACPDVCINIIVIGGDALPPPNLPTFPIPPHLPPPPPPLPLPPPPQPQFPDSVDSAPEYSSQKHLIRTSMIVGGCMIGASLILCLVFAIMRYYSSRRRPRRRNAPILFAVNEDFHNEDHGPVLDHPIWYIHTVGLSQALIDSITVCKYRKDEGLIEGTDCSVCLSEFEEDESLRLLPKCSHAFHIPCIDTWLRSHKNCPLCRAPVVCGSPVDQVSVVDSISSRSDSRESVVGVENSESEGIGSGTSEVSVTDEESVNAVSDDGVVVESSRKILPGSILAEGSCDPRALSDLADNRRMTQDDVQPMRRSVLVDSMSASRIYLEMANVIPEQGSSNSQLGLVKNAKSGKQNNANSSLSNHWRSSSYGLSLQMVPMAMKRPFSPSRKLFSSKHGRSHSSILPL